MWGARGCQPCGLISWNFPVTHYCAPATVALSLPLTCSPLPHSVWNPFSDALSMASCLSSNITFSERMGSLTSSNVVLSHQVRLCHTATFSFRGACHYLQSLWLVCPNPTYLVGSPGSRCSDGIGGLSRRNTYERKGEEAGLGRRGHQNVA